MKTDINTSTVRFRALPEADLHALFVEHREFLSRHAAVHDGRIVKPEGDGFWLVFPSVTAAALAARAMQEDLRLGQPNKADDRLAMRIVITLGDVMHEEGALVGETVVLTARIELITPPDEIYLSAAAWLAVNQAEIPTAFVDSFPLKGFSDSVSVYRVEQTHRTRILTNQYIVFTDLRAFGRVLDSSPMTTVEKILDTLSGLTSRVTAEFGGTVRFSAGDAYCLTFAGASLAMAAAERLSDDWDAFVRQEKLPCSMKVAVHHGMLYAFRSYLYGPGINIAGEVAGPDGPKAGRAAGASAGVSALDESSIFITGAVRSALAGTAWETRLEEVDGGSVSPRLAEIQIYHVEKATSKPGSFMTDIAPAVRADLAPTGKLRAAINYGNFILATKDRASGESRGVAVDLMQELGRRLGVPVEIVAYDSVAVMGDAAPTGVWDIAFLGSDPQREALMSFTAAYLEIEATYLVPGPSPLRTAADVDREGVRVAAPARANYELFLSRNLKHAQLVSTPGGDAAFDLLVTGKVDALAGLTQALHDRAQQLPGSRIVEGRFMGVQQSIAVPRGRDAGLAYLRRVVEDAKASGLVARAIEKTGARGVSVAPAAK